MGLRAFKVAGMSPPKEKLLELGNALLAKGCVRDAIRAFQAAGDKTRLLTLGKEYLKVPNKDRERDLETALMAFQATGDPKELEEFGVICLTEGLSDFSRRAIYHAAILLELRQD